MLTETEFRITREFAAPQALVWRAWTDPALLARWFGPTGTTTTVLALDPRPGGVAHLRLDSADGPQMWAKFVYREVEPPSRLVWVHSFADAQANIVASPFGGAWPRELLTTVDFADEGNVTRVTLTWVPLDANDDERAEFAANLDSMAMGWTGSFDRLDDALTARQVAPIVP